MRFSFTKRDSWITNGTLALHFTAYEFTKGSEAYKSEAACVAELMKLYQKKVEEIEKR